MNDDKLKRTLKICLIIYYIVLAVSMIYNFMVGDMEMFYNGFIAMAVPWIAPAVFKLFKLKDVYEVYIIADVFCFIAVVIGMTMHGYNIPLFDKFLHFNSGLMFTTVALALYYFLNETTSAKSAKQLTLLLVFINAVNIAIGELWEFFEFACLVFLNNDAINNATTGCYDTITDVMCATVAGLILTYTIYQYYKKDTKPNFFISLAQKFYNYNMTK